MAGGRAATATQLAKAPADREIVRVENAVKHYPAAGGAVVQAVAGVSLEVRRGETLGLVGELGCGESTLARFVAALQPVTLGRILFNGHALAALRGRRLLQARLEVRIVIQDPRAPW